MVRRGLEVTADSLAKKRRIASRWLTPTERELLDSLPGEAAHDLADSVIAKHRPNVVPFDGPPAPAPFTDGGDGPPLKLPKSRKVKPLAAPRTGDWRALLTSSENDRGDVTTRPTAHNVAVIVAFHPAWAGVLAFDERQAAPVFLKPPPFAAHYSAQNPAPCPRRVTDADATRIRAWLEVAELLTVRPDEVRAGVLVASQRACFDPVKVYLSALVWDGVARLDTWTVDYLGAKDTPYTQAVSARWMLSAVARAFEPGCKADVALVLEGAQGGGKSSAIKALVPNLAWFADELADLRSKDAALGLAGKWIVELAELAALGRADLEVMKSFFSRSVDHFRPPFAVSAEDYPRRCVFGGTTNATAYLRDETGARRFWPLPVGAIYHADLARDRDHLWAEAVARYRAGEKWFLWEPELLSAAEEEQEARYVVDEWEQSIGEWLDAPVNAVKHEFSVADVLSGALKIDGARHDQISQNRAVRALVRLRWTLHQRRTDGRRYRVYVRPR